MAWSWCGPDDPAVFKIHFSFAVPPIKTRSINKSSQLNLGGGSALVGFVLHWIALGAESGCSTAPASAEPSFVCVQLHSSLLKAFCFLFVYFCNALGTDI